MARLLIMRLLPPIIALVLLDQTVTWIVSHKLEMADWDITDCP